MKVAMDYENRSHSILFLLVITLIIVLLGIINDLINISTIESGQEVIVEEKIILNTILQGIYTQIIREIDQSHVTLSLDVALKDDHSTLLADRTRLSQILFNLLRNSIKFTSSGKNELGYHIRKAEIEFLAGIQGSEFYFTIPFKLP